VHVCKHATTSSHDVLAPHAAVFAFSMHEPASASTRHFSHFGSGAAAFGFLQTVVAHSTLQSPGVVHAQSIASAASTAAASGSEAAQHLKHPPSVKSPHEPASGVGVPESTGVPLSTGVPESVPGLLESSPLPVSANVASFPVTAESSLLLPPQAPMAMMDPHDTPTIKATRDRFIG
jgi:hypothetical protein